MNYRAISLLGGAKCTLECSYCYIKKSKEIKQIDDELIEWLKNPNIPESIDCNDVTTLSIWGGEPTLHLDIICDNFDIYKKMFPKLDEISISSNMTYPKHYEKFSKMIADNDLTVSVQISDDGLFNEENRGVKDEVIKRNTLKFIKSLHDNKCKFKYNFKCTGDIDNFEYLTNDDNNYRFFQHFDDFAKDIQGIVGKDNFKRMHIGESIICPGAYTSNDGKIFNTYLRNTVKLMSTDLFRDFKYITPNLVYPNRWASAIGRMRQISNQHHTFTCSAGDSNIIFDTRGGFHLCHRPFYFIYDDHMNSISTLDNQINDDVDYLKSGIIDVYKKYYNLDPDFKKYHMRSFHDHYLLRLSNATAVIMEAAHSNQLSEIYKDKKVAEVLAIYLNTCSYCPIENFFVTSSWHITPLSIIRLFGNGAFELINDIVYKRILNNE